MEHTKTPGNINGKCHQTQTDSQAKPRVTAQNNLIAALSAAKVGTDFLAQFPPEILAEANACKDAGVAFEVLVRFFGRVFPPEVVASAFKSDSPLQYFGECYNYVYAKQDERKAREKAVANVTPAYQRAKRKLNSAIAKNDDLEKLWPLLQDFVLAEFRILGLQQLDAPRHRTQFLQICTLAYDRNDAQFFVRLGRALSVAKLPQCDRLSSVLISNWAPKENKPGFSQLTDEAILEVCKLALGNTRLALDNVRKTRQRLGLKKSYEPFFKTVKQENGKIVVS